MKPNCIVMMSDPRTGHRIYAGILINANMAEEFGAEYEARAALEILITKQLFNPVEVKDAWETINAT